MGNVAEYKQAITYEGELFQIISEVESSEHCVTKHEIARRPPGTRLIIVNSQSDQLILISREFRREIDDWDYRLPGGKVFDSMSDFTEYEQAGGDIAEAAKTAAINEAREECGIIPIELDKFAISVCGATVEWDLYFYVVHRYTDLGFQSLGHGERIVPQWLSISTVANMCYNGDIREDRSVAILLRFLKSTGSVC